MKLLLLILLFSPLFVSCTLAPLATPKTARSLGAGKWDLDANVLAAPGVSVARGMSDNFDLGLMLEVQWAEVYSLWGKYAIVNGGNDEFSLALYGGLFFGGGVASSTGYYAGPIVSYKTGFFETYLSIRYNQLNWSAGNLDTEDRADSFIKLISWDDVDFSYFQTDLGFTLWVSNHFAINIHGKILTFTDRDLFSDYSTNPIPGLSFYYRF